MKLLIKLSFIGTGYCGFQVQKNGITVQRTVQDAAEKLFGPVALTGCSRTDSGVHARSFYCTLQIFGTVRIPPDKIPFAINNLLPPDISVRSARPVADSFHPRYLAKEKEYRYFIYNSYIRDPFLHDRAYRYPTKLDAPLMNNLAREFVGCHDFTAFMAAGSAVTDTIRTVSLCRVTQEGDMITFSVTANGFLYNMVRIMTGTLIDLSCGRLKDKSIKSIIKSRDRRRAGFTAPPQGLYLWEVFY